MPQNSIDARKHGTQNYWLISPNHLEVLAQRILFYEDLFSNIELPHRLRPLLGSSPWVHRVYQKLQPEHIFGRSKITSKTCNSQLSKVPFVIFGNCHCWPLAKYISRKNNMFLFSQLFIHNCGAVWAYASKSSLLASHYSP